MTIASAVEEQTATTKEMSRSNAAAATGSVNIASVAAAAQTTTGTVAETQRSADDLVRLSADREGIVAHLRS